MFFSYYCIQIGTSNAQPFLVGEIVSYLSLDRAYSIGDAYGFGAGMFCLALVNNISNTVLFHQVYVIGMRIRIVLGTQILKKVNIQIYT